MFELTTSDFPGTSVKILFKDGSRCFFKYAFYVQDGSMTDVITEHCGYHMFRSNCIKRISGQVGKNKTKKGRK